MTKEQPVRRIAIIGCGLSGFTVSLCISRIVAKRGLNLEVWLFDEQDPRTTLVESPDVIVLWRWAVEVLEELGLSNRLKRILSPIRSFTSKDAESGEVLSCFSHDGDVKEGSSADSLPTLYASRASDVLRAVTQALAGLVETTSCEPITLQHAANNSDASLDPVEGVPADLSRGLWFHNEQLEEHLPQLYINHSLESMAISAESGMVNLQFTNGRSVNVDMVIGADGIHSKVRSEVLNARGEVSFAKAAMFSGLTRIHLPPSDMPTEFPNGKLIPDMTREELVKFCPEGSHVAYSGAGYTLSVVHVGNGMMSWRLVLAQSEPGEMINNFLLAKQREKIHDALTQRAWNSTMNASVRAPVSEDAETDITEVIGPSQSHSRATALFEDMPIEEKEIKKEKRHSIPYLSDVLDTPMTLQPIDFRELMLRVIESRALPAAALAIVARMDTKLFTVADVYDHYEDPPEAYTSLDFHPGRVMLIGDAAHTFDITALGSYDASFAITDAALLSKLIYKHLDPLQTTDDERAFSCIATEFHRRHALCNSLIRQSHTQATWERGERNWTRSLMKVGMKWMSLTSSFEASDGAVPPDEQFCSLTPES